MTNVSTEELLQTWLRRHLADEAVAWLEQGVEATKAGNRRSFSLAFSMASRKLGKADLDPKGEDLLAADAARPGWNPSRWTVDQAARTLLVLALPANDPAEFVASLNRLFAAADVGELVALYQALPLLPFPTQHALRAAEGIRTNMKAVFEAVAHRNPFPSEQLEEGPWNQMVLKCLFIGSRLDPIAGLDRRMNPALTRMLWDYSRERRAAKRTVSPELWRCIGPFADGTMIDELSHVLREGDPLERQGAALALSATSSGVAAKTLDDDPDARHCINTGLWTWPAIAEALDQQAT